LKKTKTNLKNILREERVVRATNLSDAISTRLLGSILVLEEALPPVCCHWRYALLLHKRAQHTHREKFGKKWMREKRKT